MKFRVLRRHGRREGLTPALRAFLESGVRSSDMSLTERLSSANDEWVRRQWFDHRDEILSQWVAECPGKRPAMWWRYEAPEPRRRVGGVGQPAHECSAYAETYDFGIPRWWVMPWMLRTFSPEFRGVPIDPRDPPRYESEAKYLARLQLLTATERARLDAAAFNDELVVFEEETF